MLNLNLASLFCQTLRDMELMVSNPARHGGLGFCLFSGQWMRGPYPNVVNCAISGLAATDVWLSVFQPSQNHSVLVVDTAEALHNTLELQ